MKPLSKWNKPELVQLCHNLGIEAEEKDTKKDLITWINDEVEDLNTWLEAKAGVPSDMKKMQEISKSEKGIYKGKCVKTGEKLYS